MSDLIRLTHPHHSHYRMFHPLKSYRTILLSVYTPLLLILTITIISTDIGDCHHRPLLGQMPHHIVNSVKTPSQPGAGAKMLAERGIMDQSSFIPAHSSRSSPASSNSSGNTSPDMSVLSPGTPHGSQAEEPLRDLQKYVHQDGAQPEHSMCTRLGFRLFAHSHLSQGHQNPKSSSSVLHMGSVLKCKVLQCSLATKEIHSQFIIL